MTEKKTYPHILVINEYMSVNIDIPERLDASEIQGLMKMVSKMVNINSIKEVATHKPTKKYHTWNEEDLNTAKKLWDKTKDTDENSDIISAKLGMTAKSVKAKFYHERMKGNDWRKKK